ncbi:MAG: aldehyde dehydrogenase family protein [Rhodoferax sp.]|nr:aldehyde dehydrogenase family protein [Rhodoferax sp.]
MNPLNASAESLAAAYLADGSLPPLPQGHWIDGAECPAASGATLESLDPGLARPLAEFAAGDAEDVDRACQAAARGLAVWRRSAPGARAQVLRAMATLLRQRVGWLAVVDSLDSGKTLAEAQGDVISSARLFEYYAGHAETLEGASIPIGPDHMSWTLREPVGVTAHVIPWNYPTSTFARGIAPALAAGCSVVAKPAETSPFTALLMARWLVEAGLPPGVVNVVTGLGSTAGAALVAHPLVRHVTFTGSVPTGVRVAQAAAPQIASLTLELGGKSPLVALSDCDVEAAAEGALWAIYSNAGQVCSAGSRLVVQRAVHEPLLAALLRRTRALRVGHGLRNPDMGAIHSAQQLHRIAAMVDGARARGREVLAGGSMGADEAADTGWFYRPTILDDLPPDDPCVREEIFGPVLAVQVVDDDAQALAAANGTDYALMAGIYSRDIGRALRLARDIDAGQVTVNDYWAGGVQVPFGGNRHSGYGREKGSEGLSAYLVTKAITARIQS